MTTFKLKMLLILALACLGPAVWAQETDEGMTMPGHVTRAMKTAGFWISRHPSPDNVIMGPQRIDRFNEALRTDKKLTKDIFDQVENFKTGSLAGDLEKIYSDIASKGYTTARGMRVTQDFLDSVKRNMNLNGVVMGMSPRFGVIVHLASQRFLPTAKGLYENKDDVDFDQLQNSALDVGTPVAVVHTSADGAWYYVMTDISDGWVQAQAVALGDMNTVKSFAVTDNFALIIRPKADIFLNTQLTEYYDYARMGVRLPLSSIEGGRAKVSIPLRQNDGSLAAGQAYMNAEDVHAGFLSFTPRNIYKQAFLMLNQPYGWGDMHGEQDCSRFMQMIFSTVGIQLPRDSGPQAQAGRSLFDFDETTGNETKTSAIARCPPAETLLCMKGHIMLYLGLVNGRPYAIHDTTGYKKKIGSRVVNYDVGRVIVSDLSLGQGSAKGSLLSRLRRVVLIE